MIDEYPYSKYTMTFYEFCDMYDDWLTQTLVMSTPSRSSALISALKHRWNIYEISGETIDEFKLFLKDTFEYEKKYYEDLITEYDKEFDYRLGTTKTVTSNGKSIGVELPNKIISPDDIFDYPSDAAKDENVVSTDDKSIFLTMKQRYIRQLRNCYNEFAEKFSDCFIHIY